MGSREKNMHLPPQHISEEAKMLMSLKHEYSKKNEGLKKREDEIRIKLEKLMRDMRLEQHGEANFNRNYTNDQMRIGQATKQPSVILSQTEKREIVQEQIPIDYSQFKSCTCSHDARTSEGGGFFSYLFSFLGPNTKQKAPAVGGAASPKDATPAAPQEAPTKDNKEPAKEVDQSQQKVEAQSFRSVQAANCECSPCVPDLPGAGNIPQRGSQFSGIGDACNCSICSRTSPTAPCPCSYLQNTEDVCNCSICSRTSPTAPCPCSYAPDTGDDICSCNIHESQLNVMTPRANNMNAFGAARYGGQQRAGPNSVFGKLSLNSLNLYNMKELHDLATQEKELKTNVSKLEHQLKVYQEAFAESRNIDFSAAVAQAHSDADKKTNADLKLENFLLKNELKDMRLEVRQYLERMEGPMQFKIESERYKCQQLEKKLEETLKDIQNTTDQHNKDLNALNVQLFHANEQAENFRVENENMKGELQQCLQRCARLEEDLIRQKISEAETIKSLQAAAASMVPQTGPCANNDDCDLHNIARELSRILKECEPCGECVTLPEDLTTAARLLKSLTDMVEMKLNKAEEDLNDSTIPSRPADVKKTTDSSPAPAVQEEKSLQPVEPKTSTASKTSAGQKSKTSSVKLDVPSTKMSKTSSGKQSIHSDEGQPQIEEKPSPKEDIEDKEDSKDQGSVKNTDEPANVPSVKEETESAKISVPTTVDRSSKISVQKSNDSGKGVSDKAKIGAAGNERVTINDQPNLETILSRPKPRTSCKCVQTKRSAEVDQLWPKTDKPIELKDSEVIETAGSAGLGMKKRCQCKDSKVTEAASSAGLGMKKKCDCNIARKLREIADQQRKFENEMGGPNKNEQSGAIGQGSNKALCKCDKKATIQPGAASMQVAKETSKPDDGVDQLWPKGSERLRLSHHVIASKSQDLLRSETNVKALKVKENFPFDVDTQVDIIDKRPDGVHVTTTITDSGTLEVVTEGPEGVIETTLIYTTSGNVEVVTEILEYESAKKGFKRKDVELPAIGGVGPQPVEAAELPAISGVEPQPVEAAELPALSAAETKPSEGPPAPTKASCLCQDCPGLEKDKNQEDAKSSPTEEGAKPPSQEGAKPPSEPTQEPTDNESPEGPPPDQPAEPQETDNTQQPPQTEDASVPVEQPPENVGEQSKQPPETQEATNEALVPADETAENLEPKVIKSLSLSLHVESEKDVTVTTVEEAQPTEE